MVAVHEDAPLLVEGAAAGVGHGHVAVVLLLADELARLDGLSEFAVEFANCQRVRLALVLLLTETDTHL